LVCLLLMMAKRKGGASVLGEMPKKELARDKGESNGSVRFDDDLAAPETTLEPAPTVRGRVLRRSDGELIIEIDADGELDWIVEDEAWLDDGDGDTVRAGVDRARTTASQRLTAGQSARLVLTLPRALAGTLERVRLGALEILV